MSGFGGYRVKDRSAKVSKRRNAMPVTGKAVFVIQAVIEAKAAEARRQLEADSKRLHVGAKSKRGAK